MSLEHLRELVSDPSRVNGEAFSVFRHLFAMANSRDYSDNRESRDLTIRILDHREAIEEQYQALLTSLVRTHGLFPYLDPGDLTSDADLMAYEAHRPIGIDDEDLVFHHVQAAIYYQLLEGKSVILSAPTSFGKSLIIDALIASGRYRNVVIVVPTLALIDETRRRLGSRFGRTFKVITHPSQQPSDQNLFVYTQERVVDQEDFPAIDLFVIDEFYKLNSPTDDRAVLLNQALYRLLKTGAQFYFLGPNIESISPALPADFSGHFLQTDFSTVAVDVQRVPRAGDPLETLVDLCRSLTEPTLIYCRSPRQTRDVARALLEAEVTSPEPSLVDASHWISESFSPEWLLPRALERGIGIHNGRIPRSLAQYMVREFNAGSIRFLACTSTLIEGVNTAAKNVIIFDNKVATRRFDFFTFNNIRGRSGRMFRHFIGRVFLFHPEPEEELPFVDIPVLSQPLSTSSSLLVQLDADDLTEQSRERLLPVLTQTDLSIDVIRENRGIDPERQIEVARTIRRDASSLHPLLAWRGFPAYEQLKTTCELAWTLSGFRGMESGVASGAQLAWKLGTLRRNPEMYAFISAMSERDRSETDGDERVELALDFTRQWTGHHAPRLFLAVDRLQRDVFSPLGLRPGDYGFYVARMQGQFLPSPLWVLEEYGLPLQVAMKVSEFLSFGRRHRRAPCELRGARSR